MQRDCRDDVAVLISVSDAEGSPLGKQVRYWCEACGYGKQIGVHRPGEPRYAAGASWEWNGRVDDGIVLSPSQLHRTYVYPREGTPEERAEADRLMEADGTREKMMNHPKFGRRCHTFIGINGAPPGHVIFLGDCSHQVRGVHKLLPRKDWPERWWARPQDWEAPQPAPAQAFPPILDFVRAPSRAE